MALAFTQNEADGTKVTYAIAKEIDCFPLAQAVDVVVAGYLSQAAFTAGDSPAEQAQYTLTYAQLGLSVTDSNNPPLPTNADILAALIQLPQFAGATLV